MRIPGVLLLAGTVTAVAYGCSCGAYASAVDSYRAADAVFVGSVDTTEAKPLPFYDGRLANGQVVSVSVQEPFKGATEGQKFTFGNVLHSCSGEFKPGERLLFYLHRKKGKSEEWEAAMGCGGTAHADNASEDLLFLRGLPKTAAKNRLSGEIELYEDSPEGRFRRVRGIAGASVRIVSASLSTTLHTNADGVYEIYGIPAGEYEVHFDPPKGLKVNFPIIAGYRQTHASRQGSDGPWKIRMTEDSGVQVGFVLQEDLAITGQVLDPDGRPMQGVCLALWSASTTKKQFGSRISSCSKKDGSYKLEGMPAGSYRIVANYDDRVSADEPFPLLYYPGVERVEAAEVIHLQRGEAHRSLDFRIPKIAPRVMLRGRVLFQDGSPVPWAWVHLTESGGADHSRAEANGEGEFSIRAVTGTSGNLHTNIYAGLIDEDVAAAGCAAVWSKTVKSEPTPVVADQDRDGLLVIVPVPVCKAWLDAEIAEHAKKKKTTP